MNSWPSVPIIQASIRGIREVFRTEQGHNAAGVRGPKPWLFFLPETGVVCERCSMAQPLPDPPAGRGDATGPRTPLFGRDTRAYATYLLTTTLIPFAKQHLHPSKKKKSA